MNFSATKNGKKLDESLYTWDKATKTFSTNEDGLVLDFRYIDSCTFKTGSDCRFKAGSECTFNTGSYCVFRTYSNCTFNTGSCCVVIRQDIYEFIEIPEGVKIKLNEWREEGYRRIQDKHTIAIDGKEN